MKLVHSYREMRRAERKTAGWFFAAMWIVALSYGAIVAIHYLLGWW